MHIFKIINGVQKIFENLDIDWIKISPEDKIMSLNKCLENINVLLNLCQQESNILNNPTNENNSVTEDEVKIQESQNFESEFKNQENLERSVKMLAAAGLANVVQIADLLKISESDADKLLQSWKSN